MPTDIPRSCCPRNHLNSFCDKEVGLASSFWRKTKTSVAKASYPQQDSQLFQNYYKKHCWIAKVIVIESNSFNVYVCLCFRKNVYLWFWCCRMFKDVSYSENLQGCAFLLYCIGWKACFRWCRSALLKLTIINKMCKSVRRFNHFQMLFNPFC